MTKEKGLVSTKKYSFQTRINSCLTQFKSYQVKIVPLLACHHIITVHLCSLSIETSFKLIVWHSSKRLIHHIHAQMHQSSKPFSTTQNDLLIDYLNIIDGWVLHNIKFSQKSLGWKAKRHWPSKHKVKTFLKSTWRLTVQSDVN